MPCATTSWRLIATARYNKMPNSVRFDYVSVTPTDAAFDGEPAVIPGVVQAEQFDTGGRGYSYSSEFGESGPATQRIGDSGSIAPSGYFLSGLKAGRYINFSVNIANDGDYTLSLRAASAGAGGTLHFNLDQKPLSKPFAIPDTGGATQWREIKSPTVHLAAGQHTLALVTDSAGVSGTVADLDLFAVRPQSAVRTNKILSRAALVLEEQASSFSGGNTCSSSTQDRTPTQTHSGASSLFS